MTRQLIEDIVCIEPNAGGYGEYPARWIIDASDERSDYREPMRACHIYAKARLYDVQIGGKLFDRADVIEMTGEDHIKRQEALIAEAWIEREGVAAFTVSSDVIPPEPVFQSRRVSLAPLPPALAQTDKLITDMHVLARRAAKMLGVA